MTTEKSIARGGKKKQRLARCDGCEKIFPRSKLTEITADHESLTWFIQDLLCRECGIETGVI